MGNYECPRTPEQLQKRSDYINKHVDRFYNKNETSVSDCTRGTDSSLDPCTRRFPPPLPHAFGPRTSIALGCLSTTLVCCGAFSAAVMWSAV